MNRFLFFLFCMFLFANSKGQNNYTEAMQHGDDAFNKQQYKTAINKYFAAEAFDPTKKDLVKEKVNKTFDGIEELRNEAINSKKDAEKQKERAETALQEARNQTKIAQSNYLISEAKSL